MKNISLLMQELGLKMDAQSAAVSCEVLAEVEVNSIRIY